MNDLRVSLIQSDIIWEKADVNIQNYRQKIAALKGESDLAVLPEMCANGFGASPLKIAQYNDGLTMTAFREMAIENDIAITGSFAAKEGIPEKYFNRGFFIYPDGTTIYHDKKHLFRMGEEGKYYEAGEKPCIVRYKGWNIRLIICYDLRFPVWCRNRHLEYDLLVIVAEWPDSRDRSWLNMLEARATENQAYACGVNRVGIDGMGLHYNGCSGVYNPIGELITNIPIDKEAVQTVTLSMEKLQRNRERFPAWKDADDFQIIPSGNE